MTIEIVDFPVENGGSFHSAIVLGFRSHGPRLSGDVPNQRRSHGILQELQHLDARYQDALLRHKKTENLELSEL